MATGTTADYITTRNQLITDAYGLLGESNLSNEEINLGVRKLNALVRNLDIRGNWFWGIDQTESSLTLTSGVSEYTTGTNSNEIASNILRLEWVGKIETNEDRIPLDILTENTASSTFLKGDTNSEPVAVYLDRAAVLANNVLHVYPTPNSAYELRYTYRRPLYDFDLSTDNPDMPMEGVLALEYLLAYHLAPTFGIPLQERLLLKQQGEEILEDLRLFEPNNSTTKPMKTEYY
ncbi:MAG: hypothetical protein KDD13_00285 [Mangrovimonas sp.]|nr:hypothetical protein [Mangrovimonas sp.]